MSIPLVDNRPMTDEELDRLSDEDMDRLGDISIELTQKSYDYIKRIKNIEIKLKNEIKKLKEEQVALVATTFIGPIQVKYRKNEGITNFLLDMKEAVSYTHLDVYKRQILK